MTNAIKRPAVLGDLRLTSGIHESTVLNEGVVEVLTAATVAFTGFLALLVFAV